MDNRPNNPTTITSLSKDKVAQIFRSDQGLHKSNHLNTPQNQIKQDQTHSLPDQQPSIQHTNNPLLQKQYAINLLNYNQDTKNDFTLLYQNSLFFSHQNNPNPHSIPRHLLDFIDNLKAFRQNKVYNIILGDAHSFFQDYIHLKSLNPKLSNHPHNLQQQQQNHQINYAQMNIKISQTCANKVLSKVSSQILSGQITNIFYRKYNLTEVKQQLEDNLSSLRKSLTKDTLLLPNRQVIAYSNGEQRSNKRNQMLFQYLSSRKRQTWQDSNKSKQISEFLHKINLQRSLTHDRYKKSLQKKQLQQKKYLQQLQRLKLLEIKKSVDRQLQKHRQFKDQFSSSQKLNKQKSKQIADFLSKYQKQKPIHQRLDQSFKNKQKQWGQNDRKILDSIHEERRVISLSELQNHGNIASQRLKHKTQIMAENLNRVKHQQKQIHQKLNSLFHSKFHKSIDEEKNMIVIDEKQLKKQKVQKSLSYSVQVVAKKHRPTVDPLKKMQIESFIQQEMRYHQSMPKTTKIKRKIFRSNSLVEADNKHQPQDQNIFSVQTGNTLINDAKQQAKNDSREAKKAKQIQEQEIEIEVDSMKIGKEYLKQLRILNQGKPRKKIGGQKQQRKEERKIFDYSKQKKDHFKINLTLSEWKQVLERRNDNDKDSGRKLPTKQKQQLLKPYIKRIEADSGFYQGEKKKLDQSNTARVISLNRKLQKCYIESIRSKLQILKQ